MFDCSHMGEYRVRGKEAMEAFNREIISDVFQIPVGRCRYGAILNEAGGVMDDLITFRMAEEELYVVTNAGPIEAVTERICGDNAGAEHVSHDTAKIDVQGPAAQDLVLEAGFAEAKTLKYFNARWTEWRGAKVLISRTGYTGELGYELYMENDLAVTLWNTFLAMDGLEPAGLGARDTLRTEMGYALSGQDFDATVSPLEAGMEAFVAWDTDFVGKGVLEDQRDSGVHEVLAGIASKDRRAPRHGFEVHKGEDLVGVVTSGTFGPSVGHGVSLARISREAMAPGTTLTAGPRNMAIEITGLPFYKQGTCRKKLN